MGLMLGDTGSTPIPTAKIIRRPRRRPDAVGGDERRQYHTCNWGPPPE